MVTGMGKSGHIAGKVAATLASTGTPAFFVHPGEASHGDMGMITASDCVIALSNSGSTHEILTLLPLIRRLGIPLISMTGSDTSELAQAADVHLLASVETEACPLNLAPTSSTTAALVMGDALAIAILEATGFLGRGICLLPSRVVHWARRLLLRVADVMVSGTDIPTVSPTATLADAIVEMTRERSGYDHCRHGRSSTAWHLSPMAICGERSKTAPSLRATTLTEVMTADARTIRQELLAAEAMALMERHQISSLVVVDNQSTILGIVTLLALLKAGHLMTGRAAQKAESIKLVALDVDGVMTDGTLFYRAISEPETKPFNIKDGLGIKLLQRCDIDVVIITGRSSEALERRASELGIDHGDPGP